MKYFPAISIQKLNNRVRGFSALKLESILQGELLLVNSSVRDDKISALNKMNPKILQNKRESFIQAISNLDKSFSLEFSISSFPNLISPSRNKLEIIFFICGEDKSEEVLKEKLVSAFLNIKPLLSAFFPEADFRIVSDFEDLEKMRTFSDFNNAIAINRKFEKIILGNPFEIKKIGFGPKIGDDITTTESTAIQHVCEWKPSYDDWSNLMNVMLNQIGPTRIILRLKSTSLKEQTITNLKKTIFLCDQFLLSFEAKNISLKEQAILIKKQTLERIEKLTEASFKIGVFLLTSNIANGFLGNILGNAITGLLQNEDNSSLFQGGFYILNAPIKKVIDYNYFPGKTGLFTATEAACAFRLPSPPFEEIPPGFPVKKYRSAIAMINEGGELKNRILLASNIHQGVEQPVMIDNESRFRHCFILGQTGTGKSTLMSNMILQDIQAGRGVAVIDPHGDMIDTIIGQIPMERAEDVVLFDPLDIERPIGFNVLDWKTIQDRDLIIDELYQVFHQIYNFKTTGGPIFEQYFRGALALLMGDKKRENFIPTVLDFTRFFLDKAFRNYLKRTVDDVHLHDFITHAEEAGGETAMRNVAPYITSKFTRFQDTTLKSIVGQSSTTFSFEDILDEGKIFLIKLGKGRFGSITSALLAGMIVSRFKLAAMQRGEVPVSKRRDFFLYIDEAHNLPAENFMELLSEARKYRLGLVLATQYAAQLTKSGVDTRDNLLSALLGNVGQTIIFRLGQEDAEEMESSLAPSFGARDIIALPNWHGYVRMQQKNNALAPFSIKTVINKIPYDPKAASKIKLLSRLKYGVDISIVDQSILDRRDAWRSKN